MAFSIDFSDFDKEFGKIDKDFTGKFAKQAVFAGLNALKIDADNIPPTTPKKIGDLRSRVDRDVDQESDGTVGILVWKSKYAEYQHEGERKDGSRKVKNYSEPGSGKGFVSSKVRFGKKYRDVMGMTYKAKSGG